MTHRMPELTAGYRADLHAPIERMPASQLLGLKVIGFAQGISMIEMPIRSEITVDGRAVQGGLVGTLADYAAVSAATSSVPEGWFSATTGFEVHNLAPAIGTRLVAVGRTIKVSKSSGVASADVFAQQGDALVHVATALATCRLFQTKS
jgi:uncharacterized protein (TIGR00369 family)